MIQSVWRKQFKFTADKFPPRNYERENFGGNTRVMSEVSRRLERNMRTKERLGEHSQRHAEQGGSEHGSSEHMQSPPSEQRQRPSDHEHKTVVTLESER